MSAQYINPLVFFNFSSLKYSFGGRPYKFLDCNKLVITEARPELLIDPVIFPLESQGYVFAYLVVNKDLEIAPHIIEEEIEKFLKHYRYEGEVHRNKILIEGIISLLKISETKTSSFTPLLLSLLSIIRTHLFCRECYFFSIDFNKAILPIIGLSEKEVIKPGIFNIPMFTLPAQIAANSLSIYKEIFPKEYTLNNEKYCENEIKDIAAFPVIYMGNAKGIFVLTNKIDGEYSEADEYLLGRIEKLAGHILQENIFQKTLNQVEEVTSELSKYLSRNLAANIKEKGLEKIGGEKKKVVALYGEIKNFQSQYSKMGPKVQISLFNHVFDQLHPIINLYNGTLDKIMTPSFLIFWNHPYPQFDCEELAFNCAVKMQELFSKSIREFFESRNIPPLTLGIGLNYGEVVVGNIGFKNFMDYTVIGDVINTCQRIETQTPPGSISIHENLVKKNKNFFSKFDFTPHQIKVKGKDQSLNILQYFYDKELEQEFHNRPNNKNDSEENH